MLAVDAWAKGDFIASYTSTLARLWVTASGKFLSSWLQGSFLAAVTGCMDTLKELAAVAGKAARGRLVLVVRGCAGAGIFRGAQGFFHRRYQVSPASDITPPTKPCSPLASEHLTPFFRLNVEEKLCLSPLPPSKPLLGGWLWVGEAGRQPAC